VAYFLDRVKKLKLFILLSGMILIYLSQGMAQEKLTESRWPIAFPGQLFNKSPVKFPLSDSRLSGDLAGQFVRFVTYVKDQCVGRYRVHFTDNSGAKLSAGRIIANLNSQSFPDRRKITCALPVLAAELNRTGTALRKMSSDSKSSHDLPPSLAAGALDIDLRSLGAAPDLAARFLTMIRLISRSWPFVLAETDGWDRDNEIATASSLRQMRPWLTEFSSFTALSNFESELPCDVSSTDNCGKVKSQVSKILQVTLTRINGTPKVRRLLRLQNTALLDVVPNLIELNVLDTLVRAILDPDNRDLPWSDRGPILTPHPTWRSIMSVTSFDNLKDIHVSDNVIEKIDEHVEFVSQLVNESLRVLAPLGISDADFAVMEAIKTGFEVIYRNNSVSNDQEFLRRFINLKKFFDLQKKARTFSLDQCVQCLEPLSPFENASVENLVREIARMAFDVFDLASGKGNEESDARKSTYTLDF
jgi:hypothetical protein